MINFSTYVYTYRLQAMKRELRVKELKMLDGARQRFMHHHQQVKEAELKRLDDEIKCKVSIILGSYVDTT